MRRDENDNDIHIIATTIRYQLEDLTELEGVLAVVDLRKGKIRG